MFFSKYRSLKYVEEPKSDLHLFSVDKSMRGYSCNLYFGYVDDRDGSYKELTPLMIEIMEKIFKDRYVYTHIHPSIHYSMIKGKKVLEQPKYFTPDFMKYLVENKWEHTSCLWNGIASIIVSSIGIDKDLLNSFYSSKTFEDYGHENYIYVYDAPLEGVKQDYNEAELALQKDNYKFLFAFNLYHTGLYMDIKSREVTKEDVVNIINEICVMHNKEVIIY